MSTQYKDIVKKYLDRIRDDIQSVADNIQTDYQYDMVSNQQLRPDYRICLIMDTNRIVSRLNRLCSSIDQLSDSVE
jgi:hypothetical protein